MQSFLAGSPEETAETSGFRAGEGVMTFVFGFMWNYEKVELHNSLLDKTFS